MTGCSKEKDKNVGIGEDTEVNQHDDNENIEKFEEIPDTEEIVNTLCSDEFGGRLVGSEGNYKSEEYIKSILTKMKLDTLCGKDYYEGYNQDVFKTLNVHGDNGSAQNKEVHNVIGVIKGNDSTKALVISAHFDHIGYQDGKIIRGALDNASGVSTLIKIADILKEKSKNKEFNEDIILAFFNGEEVGLQGSKYFIHDIKDKYKSLCNINIDCVGGKKAGKITLNNNSKISKKLTDEMKEVFKKNNFVFSEGNEVSEISDQRRFEEEKIPNIYIRQENIKPYIHNDMDIPSNLDYDEISKLADILSKFVEEAKI